jgi:hypothetical protein
MSQNECHHQRQVVGLEACEYSHLANCKVRRVEDVVQRIAKPWKSRGIGVEESTSPPRINKSADLFELGRRRRPRNVVQITEYNCWPFVSRNFRSDYDKFGIPLG